MRTKKAIHILLVDENYSDLILIFSALKEFSFPNIIKPVSSTEEAIAYLCDHKMPKPDLILIDSDSIERKEKLMNILKDSKQFWETPVKILKGLDSQKAIEKEPVQSNYAFEKHQWDRNLIIIKEEVQIIWKKKDTKEVP